MIERNTQDKVWVIDSYGIFPQVDFSIYGAGGWIGCLYKYTGLSFAGIWARLREYLKFFYKSFLIKPEPECIYMRSGAPRIMGIIMVRIWKKKWYIFVEISPAWTHFAGKFQEMYQIRKLLLPQESLRNRNIKSHRVGNWHWSRASLAYLCCPNVLGYTAQGRHNKLKSITLYKILYSSHWVLRLWN